MQNKYTVKDSSISFIMAIVVPNVLAFLVLFLAGMFVDLKIIENTFFYKIMATTLSQISFALIFFFIIKTKKLAIKDSFQKEKINFKQIIILFLISLVCLFFVSPIINVVDSFLISLGLNAQTLSISLSSPRNLIYLILTIGILTPIVEELIFRGIIFQGLQNKGKKTAVLVSSLMFMLMHLSIHQTVYQFILGIILALVVLYTNNIFSSIFVHFVNNTFVLLINYFSPSFFNFNFLSSNYIIIAIILFVLAIILIFELINVLKKMNEKKKTNKILKISMEGNIKGKDYFAISIIFGIVLWILTFILSL